jgi:DNA-binding transcriptional LysR family regulator
MENEKREVLVENPDTEFQGVVDDSLEKLKLKRNVCASVPQFFMAPLIVSQSNLIMTIGSGIAEAFINSHPIQILPAPVELRSFDTNLVWHARNEKDPAMIWFRKELLAIIRKDEIK